MKQKTSLESVTKSLIAIIATVAVFVMPFVGIEIPDTVKGVVFMIVGYFFGESSAKIRMHLKARDKNDKGGD